MTPSRDLFDLQEYQTRCSYIAFSCYLQNVDFVVDNIVVSVFSHFDIIVDGHSEILAWSTICFFNFISQFIIWPKSAISSSV